MEVESKSVSIQTAVVEINTIKIDQKRMTLAVFRQIPEVKGKDVDKKDFWTFVNHAPTAHDTKEWVIAVIDGVLRRFSIPELKSHYNYEVRDLANYLRYLKNMIKIIEDAIVELEEDIQKSIEYRRGKPPSHYENSAPRCLTDISKIHTIEIFDNNERKKSFNLLAWDHDSKKDQDNKRDQDYHLADSKKRALEAIKNINHLLPEVILDHSYAQSKFMEALKTIEALPHSYIAV